jgi:putative membrane protein
MWLIKHWKPALAAALLLALAAAWQADRARQYTRGQADKAAEISLALAKAAKKQTEDTLNQERQAQRRLHAAQAAVEKERQDAQTVITDMRRELDRLRRHTAERAALPATPASARPSDGADAAEGWVLLGQCAERYAAVAETADGQRNDLAEWRAYGEAVASTAR